MSWILVAIRPKVSRQGTWVRSVSSRDIQCSSFVFLLFIKTKYNLSKKSPFNGPWFWFDLIEVLQVRKNIGSQQCLYRHSCVVILIRFAYASRIRSLILLSITMISSYERAFQGREPQKLVTKVKDVSWMERPTNDNMNVVNAWPGTRRAESTGHLDQYSFTRIANGGHQRGSAKSTGKGQRLRTMRSPRRWVQSARAFEWSLRLLE